MAVVRASSVVTHALAHLHTRPTLTPPEQVLYLVSSTAECFLSRKYGLRVGAPYGGVCLPKDVPELTSLAPEGSVFREFLSGTGKINEWITNTPSLKVILDLFSVDGFLSSWRRGEEATSVGCPPPALCGPFCVMSPFFSSSKEAVSRPLQ